MSRKFITAAVGVGVAGALTVGVCIAAQDASAAATRPVMTYTISKSGKIAGASRTAPGYAAIAVAGPKSELFQLARVLHSHVGKSKVISDTNAVNRGNAKPVEADFKTVGGVAGGNTLFVNLDPGTYFALDVNAKKLTKDDIQTIYVAGARQNAARPEVTGTVTSVGDMKWSSKNSHIAASGYLQFKNRSEHNLNNTHFVDLEKLKNGKGKSDLDKVFMGKEPPSAVFDSGPGKSYGTGVLSHGKTQVSSYKLVPGTYMLACFFPDRANGQPHAFMGMYRVITVG